MPVANVFVLLDDDPLPLDEASSSVDALVADDDGLDDSRLSFLSDEGRVPFTISACFLTRQNTWSY